MRRAEENTTESRWLVSKIIITDIESNQSALVTLYGYARREMSLSSIQPMSQTLSEMSEMANRICYLIGKGDSFVIPDTRLQVKTSEFFKGKLNAFAQQKYVPGLYKMGRILAMNNEQKMICQVTKIGHAEISELFTYLSVSEMKDVKENRKKNSLQNKDKKNTEGKSVKLRKKEEKRTVTKVPVNATETIGLPVLNKHIPSAILEPIQFSESSDDECSQDQSLSIRAMVHNTVTSSDDDDEISVVDNDRSISIQEYISNDIMTSLKLRHRVKNVTLGVQMDNIPEINLMNENPRVIKLGEEVCSLLIRDDGQIEKGYSGCVLLKDMVGFDTSRGAKLIFIR